MKKLGMGMMRLPLLNKEDNTSVDVEQVKEMVDLFLSHGFDYFDTAYMYHGAVSEAVVREVLVKRYPREKFRLASKLPTMRLAAEGDQERIFAEQLEKCGVTYFDNYLLHSLNQRNWEAVKKFDSFAFVSEMKKQGKIRRIGFSFHDTPELLDEILTAHPETEFVQLQINYLDWENERVQSSRCYEVARRHGKPVIVMEPVKGGTLASLPPRASALLEKKIPGASPASWAIRYAAGLDGVETVLSGMSDLAQLNDNIGFMEHFEPLSADELALLPEIVEIIRSEIAVDCTACRYCVDGCPAHIDIPALFAIYNANKGKTGEGCENAYREATKNGGKASECIRCYTCAKICPQHIRIPDAMTEITARLERK